MDPAPLKGKAPRISVILPVFNGECTILDAVTSILNGSFKDLELLVADDGSTDHTVRQLKTLTDHRLRILEGAHRGVVATTNRAASAARAEWIARMDADDHAYPHRLQAQWDFAQRSGCQVIGGLVRIVDLADRPVSSMQRYEDWLNQQRNHSSILAQRFVELPLVNPSILAQRDLFVDQCRSGPFPEDYDHWLGILANNKIRVGKVDSVILDWRDHPDRLTRCDSRYSLKAFNHCKRLHLLEGPLKGCPSVALWGAGQTGKPWLRWLLDMGYKVPSVVEISERKIGQQIHGVPVISPKQVPHAGLNTPPLLVAVGAMGAREEISDFLASRGYVQGVNLWCVA
ncbi:MAG: glycosyltransferase [Verrucomicrobiota bacterium]|nr:glycosyltransferase [Verrucomicrobiota bacterium]